MPLLPELYTYSELISFFLSTDVSYLTRLYLFIIENKESFCLMALPDIIIFIADRHKHIMCLFSHLSNERNMFIMLVFPQETNV